MAGLLLRDHGLDFRSAYTSVLGRAIETLHLIESAMGLLWINDTKDWRLNEKHYGILQGWSKRQTANEYGAEQVLQWRRAFDAAPPPLAEGDERGPEQDPRYAGIDPACLPRTESLRDTAVRVRSCWQDTLLPALQRQESLLVVAHGNSLRALLMLLKRLSPEEVMELNIPTALPLCVEIDEEGTYHRDHYLGNQASWERGIAEARGM